MNPRVDLQLEWVYRQWYYASFAPLWRPGGNHRAAHNAIVRIYDKRVDKKPSSTIEDRRKNRWVKVARDKGEKEAEEKSQDITKRHSCSF